MRYIKKMIKPVNSNENVLIKQFTFLYEKVLILEIFHTGRTIYNAIPNVNIILLLGNTTIFSTSSDL